jgi:tRNA(Ile)-lysidine synthase
MKKIVDLRIQHTLESFLENSPLEGKTFMVMCSGGQDSMVLADAVHRLGYALELVHVNYGLRGTESDGDQAFVEAWAAERSLPIHVTQAPSDFGDGPDLQARARGLRYELVQSLFDPSRHAAILVAHHADDAAETFLFHAARGTGLDGLVALAPQVGNMVRPLWDVAKSQVAAHAKKQGLAWRDDSSNASDKYTRNHLRHHALPALREAMPQALEGLRTTLKNLRDLQAFVDATVKRESILYLGKSKEVPGAHVLYRDVLDHPHSSVIVWYNFKEFCGVDFEAVLSLAQSQVGAMLQRGKYQLWAEREGLLLLKEDFQRLAEPHILGSGWTQLQGPLWNGKKWEAHTTWKAKQQKHAATEDLGSLNAPVLSLERTESLVWRPWTEGDFLLPLGMKGRKKVSDILTEAKVPAGLRKYVVVLAAGATAGEVYWVPGARLSRTVAVQAGDSHFWRLTERR